MILLADMYEAAKLEFPFVVVDANHANSQKKFNEQPRIIKEILHSRKINDRLHNLVRGVMIESFIEEGNQPPEGGVYGKSITDACIGWKDTEELLLHIADNV